MVNNEPDFLNWRKTENMELVGEFGFPKVKGIRLKHPDDTHFIGFNYATNSKTTDKEKQWIHFFLPDYRFTQVWNNPDRYIDVFKQYKGILTPDFSVYVGMSKAMQIWNVYRNSWLQAYYQQFGIKSIPSLTWADESTYDFCFDWVPKHSAVCISTVGCMQNREAYRLFIKGYDKALEVCEPSQVILYGTAKDEVIKMYPEANVVPSFITERKRQIIFKNELKTKLSTLETPKVLTKPKTLSLDFTERN